MKQEVVGKICVSIGQRYVEDAVVAAKDIAEDVDVIEIRLDALESPSIIPFVSSLQKPLLFTCRPVWEGGLYKGDEASRIDLLCEAVRCGAAYIDLELLALDQSLSRVQKALHGTDTQLIVSNHNFETTPPRGELLDILNKMKECGAHIGKLISTAHSYLDVLRVLQLQEDAAEINLPLIAFCMGSAGVISRLGTLELGGYMTYCSLEGNSGMAPGQIPVKAMHELIRLLHQD